MAAMTDQSLARRHSARRQASRISSRVNLAAALGFAICLWAFDWEAFRGIPFEDLQNYIMNFYRRNYYTGEDGTSLLQWYSQEYLWRTIIYALSEHFPLESIFSVLTLVVLSVMCAFVAVKSGSPFYLLLLIHPQFIDLAFSQVRSAIAMSAIYLALLLSWRSAKYALIALSPFIHSGVLVFSGAFGTALALTKYERLRRYRVVVAAGYIAGVAIALTIFRSVILEYLGDRRATLAVDTGGFLRAAMLSAYAAPFLLFRRMFSRDFEAFLIVIASTLCAAFYLDGQNGLRFVALALPAFAVAISRITDLSLRGCTIACVLLSQLVYMAYWARGI